MRYLDLIAELGVSGAHPGGLDRTRRMVKELHLPAGARVLDAGCGTGESACFLAQMGYAVTALENNDLMLAKAKERADKEGLKIEWVKADVENMPLPDRIFDAVLVESVTIFTGVRGSLAEYFRVLKPKGHLLECEMCLIKPMPSEVAEDFCDFMSLRKLFTVNDWLESFREAGFRIVSGVVEPAWVQGDQGPEKQDMDPSKLNNPGVMEAMMKYLCLVVAHTEHFGAGMFAAERPSP